MKIKENDINANIVFLLMKLINLYNFINKLLKINLNLMRLNFRNLLIYFRFNFKINFYLLCILKKYLMNYTK